MQLPYGHLPLYACVHTRVLNKLQGLLKGKEHGSVCCTGREVLSDHHKTVAEPHGPSRSPPVPAPDSSGPLSNGIATRAPAYEAPVSPLLSTPVFHHVACNPAVSLRS